MITLKLILIVVALALPVLCVDHLLVWGYQCRDKKCNKVRFRNQHGVESLSVCKLLCGADDDFGTVWPKPTGTVKKGRSVVQIDRGKIRYNIPSITTPKVDALWKMVKVKFQGQIDSKVPELSLLPSGGRTLLVRIKLDHVILSTSESPKLTYDTDESYALQISQGNNNIVFADISAKNFFGARHGLETLSQLIVYDTIARCLQIMSIAVVNDGPVFKHRGVLLDTSRNYFSVKSIKRTIDAMSMSKMNVFHWHMIDANSFPFVVKSHPDFHNLGAYSAYKIYTHQDVTDLVDYALARGVRVIPEFGGPSHAGEGWQDTQMTVCFKAQPWKEFCLQPPCGQLDPTIDELYNVLGDIYEELFKLFDPDVFHMGGFEVSANCWNSSENIRNWMFSKGWALQEEDFIKLWGHFQTKALAKVDSLSENDKKAIIVWTSRLTDPAFIDKYLDKDRYIIQVWKASDDKNIQEILKRGYKIVLSNYDALFFNCEHGGWVGDGNNFCSPYILWQKVYENSPDKIVGDYKNATLGAEAAIWTEQVDEHSVDARLWPRASALAERLWSNPTTNWKSAESRMLVHREFLTQNGIAAESIQPEWCLRNQNECPIDAYETKEE